MVLLRTGVRSPVASGDHEVKSSGVVGEPTGLFASKIAGGEGGPAPERFGIYRDADSKTNNGHWTNFMPEEAAKMVKLNLALCLQNLRQNQGIVVFLRRRFLRCSLHPLLQARRAVSVLVAPWHRHLLCVVSPVLRQR